MRSWPALEPDFESTKAPQQHIDEPRSARSRSKRVDNELKSRNGPMARGQCKYDGGLYESSNVTGSGSFLRFVGPEARREREKALVNRTEQTLTDTVRNLAPRARTAPERQCPAPRPAGSACRFRPLAPRCAPL